MNMFVHDSFIIVLNSNHSELINKTLIAKIF